MKQQKGFTLIELLVVIAILGIITAIAVPSYSSFVERARRVDAITILSEVAGEQQRFLTENNRYATSMTELGYTQDPLISDEGYYSVTTANPSITSFVLSAVPIAGEAQASDTECGTFTLNSGGVKDSANGVECW